MKLPSEAGDLSDRSGSVQREAHACYRALLEDSCDQASEPSLGGRLLYAGQLDASGAAMMVAGNVAGCATLAATGDQAAQKQATREGVVDFVVNSLDEALRILKNEVRKRNSVGVCIGSVCDAVELEMIERGVLPDMVFVGTAEGRKAARFGEHVREIRATEPKPPLVFLRWQVGWTPARWMPKLDAIALDCLAGEPWTQRWIRLSPRYLGRANLRERAFYCAPEAPTRILREFDAAVGTGAIETEVSVSIIDRGESRVYRLRPPAV